MKKYLRFFLFNLVSLWLVTNIVAGFTYGNDYLILIKSAAFLTLINLLIKPLINLLLLPINLITLGTFRWLGNVIALFLVTMFVPQLKIASFTFPGFIYQGFIIPSLHLTVFWVLFAASFIISLTYSFLLWLSE